MPSAKSKTETFKMPVVKQLKGSGAKALPVTLLSGFLGSSKTTLLQHILSSSHNLRIAVIVNDIGAINVDASLIRSSQQLRHTSEKVIALQNGCICCTLRGDLLEELVRLSEIEQFDYVVVESSGISEPEQVAETFDRRLVDVMAAVEEQGLAEGMVKALEKIKQAGGLERFARLDTTVTVIDAFTLFHDFETNDMLSSRRDDVVPEDERTVSDLMVDQIEFAEVIILNKIDMVDQKTRARMRDLISKLNHRAKVIETSHGRIDVNEIINTGSFDLDVAQTGYGWLQDLHAMTLREMNGRKVITPKPETEEYNVRNFVYQRLRPFHPLRLYELLHDKFILQHQFEEEDEDEMQEHGVEEVGSEEDESDEDESDEDEMDVDDSEYEDDDAEMTPPELPSPEVILANKRTHPLFSRLFRSKGAFWLATRPNRAGDWSQAGAMLTLQGGRPWFCCVERSEWESGDKELDALVEHDMRAKWGDRRQELVFIGEALDVGGVEAVLDACLLTNEEMKTWEGIMENRVYNEKGRERALVKRFDDGFPNWIDEEDGGHEGHDHVGGHPGH